MSHGFESAERVRDEQGRQYHIGLAPDEVARYIMLVGDPARATRVAGLFDSVELERRNREFVTYTGMHAGLRLTVMGTGMGAGPTEIAVVELCQLVDRPVMIRCGSAGALQPDMQLGDLAISRPPCASRTPPASSSTRATPPSPTRRPCSPSPPPPTPVATATTSASPPPPPASTAPRAARSPASCPREPDIVARLAAQGIKNLEMETSCLLTLAALRGFPAGAVCAIYATRHDNVFITPEQKDAAELACVTTGLHALHTLAAMEAARGARPIWHPGLPLNR
jgi:uridine phosphorylase